ncbi:MAG: dihydropteroate synthase [Thaumarchaeota archaeon]|nr:dihydropteroate synthase [Nitrososphaerota archaeon]
MGPREPVRLMSAINVSPESFYKGSFVKGHRNIAAQVRTAIEQGADLIDVGGMSTSPYLAGEVSEEVEGERIREALRSIFEAGKGTTVSVDTMRSSVAEIALRDGASVVNDVSGLKHDPAMAKVIRDRGASLLAMAHSSNNSAARPIPRILAALKETIAIADRRGIERRSIVLDPGIGFFREKGLGPAYSPQRAMPWYAWDIEVLANLEKLETLGRPLCVGLSRKSFMGEVLGLDKPEDRLPASLAATAIAVVNGACIIRTHDVKETLHAVRIAEALKRRSHGRTSTS